MLTESETDILVEKLRKIEVSFGWPEHVAEYSRYWLKQGAKILHVGPATVVLEAWSGARLRINREDSADGARRAREEFYDLVGDPVVDEEARLIAQSGERFEGRKQQPRNTCPEHSERVIGCNQCGLPVIERIGPCGCPRPRPWIDGHPNIRAITGQLDHVVQCPGFDPNIAAPAPVNQAREPTEIIKPKPKKRGKEPSQPIVSLDLFPQIASRTKP